MPSGLARNIEYWRQIRGYSQAQLSQLAGLATTAINDILRSPGRSPRLQTVERIAQALDITLWQLLEGADSATKSIGEDAGGRKPESTILLLEHEDFSSDERAQAETYPEAVRAGLRVAVLGASQALAIGALPGQRLAVVPMPDYAGRLVLVTHDSGEAEIRYCAPPWLIALPVAATPWHEFMEKPGITIRGSIIVPSSPPARFPPPAR